MKNKAFGEFLKEAREKKGISQAEVAKQLGYSTPQFVSNWERASSSPPVEVLKSIARIYGIAPERVLAAYLEGVFKWNKEKITKKWQRSK
jgi:transcriptional regulator with XRE-family HTH domain